MTSRSFPDDIARNKFELGEALRKYSTLSNEIIYTLVSSSAEMPQFKMLSMDLLAIVLIFLQHINYQVSAVTTPEYRQSIIDSYFINRSLRGQLDQYLQLLVPDLIIQNHAELPKNLLEKYLSVKADFLRYTRLVVNYRETQGSSSTSSASSLPVSQPLTGQITRETHEIFA